jgi:hypothetical protein
MTLTVLEVTNKKATLETVIGTTLEAVKALTPGSPEFDEAYGRYLSAKVDVQKIPEELKAAVQAENADKIKATCATVASAIQQLLAGLKAEELMGTPIIALRYAFSESKDDKGVVTKTPMVVLNPIEHVKQSGPKTTSDTTGKGTGHNMIILPDGSKKSLTKFVNETATETEKASAEFKYPHTRVDSKPKFEAYCTAHNLTGYSYELASK